MKNLILQQAGILGWSIRLIGLAVMMWTIAGTDWLEGSRAFSRLAQIEQSGIGLQELQVDERDGEKYSIGKQGRAEVREFKKLDESFRQPLYVRQHQKWTADKAFEHSLIKCYSTSVEPVFGRLINYPSRKGVNCQAIAQASAHTLIDCIRDKSITDLRYNLEKHLKFLRKPPATLALNMKFFFTYLSLHTYAVGSRTKLISYFIFFSKSLL